MRVLIGILLVLLTGCYDSNCDCYDHSRELIEQFRQEISPITTATPAGMAAQYVLKDSTATQERKAQALQLLFELERAERFDKTMDRLNGVATKLEAILEKKLEAEDR